MSAIAKQRTYTDADREQAFAEYTVLGNWELVSRKMGIPVNTLKSWWRRHPPDMDEYAEKRREVREGFIETASKAIENGAELINRRLELALKQQRELEELMKDIPADISTHTLRGERDSTYCICEVTPPQQSGHFTKNHFKKRYFLHNMYYFFSEPPYKPISLHVRSQNQTALRIICFLCTYMLHSPLPIITQIIESKAILFFINNFHKSIF